MHPIGVSFDGCKEKGGTCVRSHDLYGKRSFGVNSEKIKVAMVKVPLHKNYIVHYTRNHLGYLL